MVRNRLRTENVEQARPSISKSSSYEYYTTSDASIEFTQFTKQIVGGNSLLSGLCEAQKSAKRRNAYVDHVSP